MKKYLIWGGGAALVFVVFAVIGPALISAKDSLAVGGGFAFVGTVIILIGIGIKHIILDGEEDDE